MKRKLFVPGVVCNSFRLCDSQISSMTPILWLPAPILFACFEHLYDSSKVRMGLFCFANDIFHRLGHCGYATTTPLLIGLHSDSYLLRSILRILDWIHHYSLLYIERKFEISICFFVFLFSLTIVSSRRKR